MRYVVELCGDIPPVEYSLICEYCNDLATAQVGGGVRRNNEYLCKDCLAVFSAYSSKDPLGILAQSSKPAVINAGALDAPSVAQVNSVIFIQHLYRVHYFDDPVCLTHDHERAYLQ